MAVLLSHKKFTVYGQGRGATELIILSHGGMTTGGGVVSSPETAKVIFYTRHWSTSAGGRVADALVHCISANYKAKPTSIASPGSPVWNYTLTWDGPGGQRPYERAIIDEYSKGTGNSQYDLATPEEGQHVTLKELFKAIEKAGLKYQTIHYCPCRVVSDESGKDVYDPQLQRDMDSGQIKFQ